MRYLSMGRLIEIPPSCSPSEKAEKWGPLKASNPDILEFMVQNCTFHYAYFEKPYRENHLVAGFSDTAQVEYLLRFADRLKSEVPWIDAIQPPNWEIKSGRWS